jgi:hypothetical protein
MAPTWLHHRREWCVHFDLHQATMASEREHTWIKDDASALALPAERLVVGDAVHPVAEQHGAQHLLLVSSLVAMFLGSDGHLHRLTVAAERHAHPLAPRRPGPPPLRHRLSSHGLSCPFFHGFDRL